MWQTWLIVAVALLAGGIVTLGGLSLMSRRAPTLGVKDGKLTPCGSLPRCVSSQAPDEAHWIEPFRFADDPEEAWQRLQRILTNWPRTRIVEVSDTYLHAECTTALFRFIDDVEFLLDREAGLIHLRSSSRVGRSDLGTNRRRMEEMRQAFTAN